MRAEICIMFCRNKRFSNFMSFVWLCYEYAAPSYRYEGNYEVIKIRNVCESFNIEIIIV